jgi:2-(1,2-epoxy-1,2-dihydrophenyl)acetyl-CoA isomerase
MQRPQVHYEVSERIGTITLDRPEAMNAFGGTMREDLLAHLKRASADPSVRCVVITGTGKAFSAGGDIASMTELQARNDISVIQQRMQIGSEVIACIRSAPKAVVAAINGAAAGAGLNLALACDMRLAAASARFAASFVKIGLVPDWGGTWLLTRLVGTAKAMELMMSGDRFEADEALRLGLVNQVYPDASFRQEVQAFAVRLAAGPAATLAAIKRAAHAGATGTLEESLGLEAETQCALFLSDDAREGMRAFVEKRSPKFS